MASIYASPMSHDALTQLPRRLLERYDDFVRRLSRRVGSADVAREVIHETYIRLQRLSGSETIHNPDGYIFQTAINIAKNRSVVERRYLNAREIDELIAIPDEAPGPAQVAEARSGTAQIGRALEQLPARRRAIFEASWVEETPHAELAIRYGVHIRTIQREIEHATRFVRVFCENEHAGECRD